jgi:regulator of sigma E protease
MLTTLLVIGILIFLIVAHELGHFAAAKLFKVKVEEFGLGYPPRAFLITKKGDTEYTFNWIPFGGFVRLLGENADAPKQKGSFAGAPRYAQAIILVAGVVMNLIVGYLLFAGALFTGIPHAVDSWKAGEHAQLFVSGVLPNSPADSAHVLAGDEIVAMRDAESGEAARLSPDSVIAFVEERGGKAIEMTVLRGDEEITATVHPAHSVIADSANRPALGVGLVLVESDPLPLIESLTTAVPLTIDKLFVVFTGLASMLQNAFAGAPALEGVVGPVGLVSVVGEASQHGVGQVLALAAFISVNLVIVNLLPIPALDGGRLVLVGIESVIRRAVPRFGVALFNAVGIFAILVLMVTVTYNDVVRLLF